MRSASDLMGTPVLSVGSGEKIGHLNGILLDAQLGQVVALEVKTGLFGGLSYVRWIDVRSIGPDAITLSSEQALRDRKDIEDGRELQEKLSDRAVFTENGEHLGDVADYQIDTTSGHLLGVIVRPTDAPHGLFGASDSKDFFVPMEQIQTLGGGSVVVRNAVRELIHDGSQSTLR